MNNKETVGLKMFLEKFPCRDLNKKVYFFYSLFFILFIIILTKRINAPIEIEIPKSPAINVERINSPSNEERPIKIVTNEPKKRINKNGTRIINNNMKIISLKSEVLE